MSDKIPMKCHNCGHEWAYGGKREFYATCPNCHYQVNIKKQTIREGNGDLGQILPKEYVCLAGSRSFKEFLTYMKHSPNDCKPSNCLRGYFESDWEEIKDDCYNRRVKKTHAPEVS